MNELLEYFEKKERTAFQIWNLSVRGLENNLDPKITKEKWRLASKDLEFIKEWIVKNDTTQNLAIVEDLEVPRKIKKHIPSVNGNPDVFINRPFKDDLI